MLIAPATANVIAKLAHGLADDMLTTVTLAARCPKLVAPAMNTHMLENPITQDNLKTLEHYGFTVIPSGSGLLACGDTGSGRLPDEGVLVDYVARELEHEKDMQGMKVVVSAGGTREPMDPVRYLTNHSTGKMGYAVARACMLRGADVTLLTSSDLPPVPFVKMVPFATAAELFEAVKANAMDADALVMAAAVADYRPAQVAQDKIKKHDGELSIELERTDDILGWVGEHKPEQLFVCGFSMETKDLIENSTAKLHKKNMDMIVANNVKVPGAGFGVDTNVVTLITESKAEKTEKVKLPPAKETKQQKNKLIWHPCSRAGVLLHVHTIFTSWQKNDAQFSQIGSILLDSSGVRLPCGGRPPRKGECIH